MSGIREEMVKSRAEISLQSHQRKSLELTAIMLNVNRNHNEELMEACQDLKDYAEYADRIRRLTKEMDLGEAVERTITECIQEGILGR